MSQLDLALDLLIRFLLDRDQAVSASESSLIISLQTIVVGISSGALGLGSASRAHPRSQKRERRTNRRNRGQSQSALGVAGPVSRPSRSARRRRLPPCDFNS